MRVYQTALVLIGFQNDYFDDDGFLQEAIELDTKAILRSTVELLESLRSTDIFIITTPIIFTSNLEKNELKGIGLDCAKKLVLFPIRCR